MGIDRTALDRITQDLARRLQANLAGRPIVVHHQFCGVSVQDGAPVAYGMFSLQHSAEHVTTLQYVLPDEIWPKQTQPLYDMDMFASMMAQVALGMRHDA